MAKENIDTDSVARGTATANNRNSIISFYGSAGLESAIYGYSAWLHLLDCLAEPIIELMTIPAIDIPNMAVIWHNEPFI